MLQATIAGRVGRDAEIKASKNGKDYATFSVAVNTGIGDDKVTTWIGVKTMRTGIAPYVKKGDPITVVGDLSLDEGKNGKSYLNLFATGIELQAGKRDASEAPAAREAAPVELDDDLPF